MPLRDYTALRQQMIGKQIHARGLRDPIILQALSQVERHRFVPQEYLDLAYADRPLPIGHGQTISQPYIVALMTQLCRLTPHSRVLEIGTGCGYQTALLAKLCRKVYTIEVISKLAERAKQTLGELGYTNIAFRTGDGREGWPENAPFDAILAAAAAEDVPAKLLEQMKMGARTVIPIGKFNQHLLRIHKTPQGWEQKEITPVRFVVMQKM